MTSCVEVTRNLIALLMGLLNLVISGVHILIADNGTEFSWYEKVARGLKAAFYFVHPYSLWEKGLNENINGLVKQYFTK